MPTADSLTGLGMPPQLAELMGGNPNVTVGTGTTQGAAAKILSKNTEVTPSAGNTGFIVPPITSIFDPYFLSNPTATAGVIYVPTGHTINGTLNPTNVAIPANSSLIIWQYKPKFWATK